MGGCVGVQKGNQRQQQEKEDKPLVPPVPEKPKEDAKKVEGGDIYRPENLKDSNNKLNPPASQINQSQLSGSRGSHKDVAKPKINLEEIQPDRLRRTEAKNLKETKAIARSRINDQDYLVKEKEGIKLENKIEEAFINNGEARGFENPDLKDKCIQPVVVRMTTVNRKLREHESEYQDQTRGGAEVLQISMVMPDKAELVLKDLPELKMAQIKTYLFDRSLDSRLTE